MTRLRFGIASLVVLAGFGPVSAQAATLMGDAQAAFDVAVVAEDLSQPTDIAELPDGRIVITERLGGVVVVGTDGMTTDAGTIAIDDDFGEQGLLGVVADPNFATNNTLYFYASVGSDLPNKHKVYKIPLGADSMLATSRDTIISNGLSASSFGNHNGGGLIVFENHLYVSVGDSGYNSSPPTNRLASCLNSANGKILRVGLDGSVPADNPLSNETMVSGCTAYNSSYSQQAPDKRVFFWGMRNPYRYWIDPQTKRMWIGDVGETTREEISVSAPIDSEMGKIGQHFGYPFFEGTTNHDGTMQSSWRPENDCMGIAPGRDCVQPVFDYQTTRGSDACVIGGLIPDGCGWEAPWTSRYFFGDNSSGRVWTLDVNANRDGVVADSRTQIASTQGIGSFRMGAKGALYLAEVSGGVVSKITPKGLDPTMCAGSSGGAGGMGGGSSGSGTTAGTDAGGTSSAQGGTSSAQGGSAGSGTAGTGTPGGQGGTGPGTGGAPAQGGSAGTSGPGTSGSTSAGTSSTTAGAPAGGRSGAPSGGSTSAGTSTGGPSDGGDAADDGGCGCRVVGGKESVGGLILAATGLAFFGLRRSRSRKQRRS